MKIPETFKLYGHSVSVRSKIKPKEESPYGGSDSEKMQITVAVARRKKKKNSLSEIPTSIIQSSFLHELLHMSLYFMGEYELAGKHSLIESLANILQQALYADEKISNIRKLVKKALQTEKKKKGKP